MNGSTSRLNRHGRPPRSATSSAVRIAATPGRPRARAGIEGKFRVSVRRAQHQRMHRGLRRVVVGVAALAANQRIVFLAQDALTDAEFDGSHLISDCECPILRHIAADRAEAQTALAAHRSFRF